MCNLLFENWCHEEYGEKIVQFSFVNGAGGDGGVEAFCVLDTSNNNNFQICIFQK